ncbi:glucokinase [Candidatus Colwellia aromaticivorans]|uniref:glucokinase n=1 Tax=Candidatus Colwellia aromaticivorans TaxID=2267621 RepID=UPI000DF25C50|nr:glucokinase [Candidatus Colwellia aromaticivorans]
MNKIINLVADIGGTNIRLALSDKKNNLTNIETYQCTKFKNLFEVISQYLTEHKIQNRSINACLAIACPIDNDLISMTNLPWKFSQKDLKQQLNLNSLTLINDFTAIAMAIPFLSNDQKVQIGSGESTPSKAISVCGPGTGLGVATLIPVDNKWHCLGGEGGHMDFAPVDTLEIKILHYLQGVKNRVSYEQLLSGYGLEQIYQALIVLDSYPTKRNAAVDKLTAAQISARAVANSCSTCYQALSLFCRVLGSFAGNLALMANSLGGVYIAGGIVPKFIEFIQQSDFRSRFEAKGRLTPLTQQSPTYVITEKQPGLLGASAYLNQFNCC